MAISIYEPLRSWLASCGKDTVHLTFAEIERIINRPLPASALKYDVWWHNEDEPSSTHTQSKYGWCAAGYLVTSVDRGFPCVTFTRKAAAVSS